MSKLTKNQLDLQERKLEIQERKTLLKVNNKELETRDISLSLEKIEALRQALQAGVVDKEAVIFNSEPKFKPLFEEKEFEILKKRYFEMLKQL